MLKFCIRLMMRFEYSLETKCVNKRRHRKQMKWQTFSAIRTLCQYIQVLLFQHVYREANFIVDVLVMLGYDQTQPSIWFSNFLFSIVCKVLYDVRNLGIRCRFLTYIQPFWPNIHEGDDENAKSSIYMRILRSIFLVQMSNSIIDIC